MSSPQLQPSHPVTRTVAGMRAGLGRLLCARHHTIAHDQRYRMNPSGSGQVAFVMRT